MTRRGQVPHFNEKESVFNAGARIKLTNLNTFLLAAGRSLPGSTNHEPRFFYVRWSGEHLRFD